MRSRSSEVMCIPPTTLKILIAHFMAGQNDLPEWMQSGLWIFCRMPYSPDVAVQGYSTSFSNFRNTSDRVPPEAILQTFNGLGPPQPLAESPL